MACTICGKEKDVRRFKDGTWRCFKCAGGVLTEEEKATVDAYLRSIGLK
jgi:ribosomal protein L37AE/L43A